MELAAAAEAAAAQYDEFERDGDDAFRDGHPHEVGGAPFVPPPPPPQAVAMPPHDHGYDNGYAPSNGYEGHGNGYGNGYHPSMHAGSAIPVAPLWDQATHGAPMAPMAVAMPYHPPPPGQGYPMAGARPPMAAAMHPGMAGPHTRSLFSCTSSRFVPGRERDASACVRRH